MLSTQGSDAGHLRDLLLLAIRAGRDALSAQRIPRDVVSAAVEALLEAIPCPAPEARRA